MSTKKTIAAITISALGLLAIPGESPAGSPSPKFPFELELVKPLGFRLTPGLAENHVLPNQKYLQPPTKLTAIMATGVVGMPNAYCFVKYGNYAGYIRCDDLTAFKITSGAGTPAPAHDSPGPTPPPSSSGGVCTKDFKTNEAGLKFCTDVESCKRFCTCACDFDPSKWKANEAHDGSTVCPRAPQSGAGMIAQDSRDLLTVPVMQYVKSSGGLKATKQVVDGLTRLDGWLAKSPARGKYNYTVWVKNCYRPAIDDTEIECGFVRKAMHMIEKSTDPAKRREWEPKLNPQNLGLAWPGATPHSSGNACDIVLRDAKGNEAFNYTVGAGTPHSSIDQKLASSLLDEALTNPTVGALRLRYETWHYEWGGTTSCRCKYPDCGDKYWPPTGTPAGCQEH